ncbi:MAG: hypothetical protein LBD55_03570 [Treponema sp.]|nr:hypothetical protein [Treponema sp.]
MPRQGPGDRNGGAASGTPILSDRITKYSETPTPADGSDTGDYDYTAITGEAGWRSTAAAAYFDTLPLADRQRAAQLLLAPRLASGADLLFPAAKGGVWARNYGTRFMLRGGYYGNGASAGLAACSLNTLRTSLSAGAGFRPAFIM